MFTLIGGAVVHAGYVYIPSETTTLIYIYLWPTGIHGQDPKVALNSFFSVAVH